MKLSCADFTWPLLPHEKVLDLIHLLDLEGVDIGFFGNRVECRHARSTGPAGGADLRSNP